MTHLAARFAAEVGVPPGRVFGSGTTLDTARFRTLLGTHCGVDSHHVHGYVIGEHGDSEVLTWSLVSVGGMPLEAFARMRGVDLSDAVRRDIDEKVRRAAYTIIGGKGATYYGIGCALARIVDAVLHDQRSILTVCAPTADVAGVKDVTVALPRLVGGAGVIETFPLPLSETEQAQLRASAGVIRTGPRRTGRQPLTGDTEGPSSWPPTRDDTAADPHEDRRHDRPGLAHAGGPAAVDRGRRQRVPAQLLARDARGALRRPRRHPGDQPRDGPARRRPAGPVRAEDAARADPRRPGRVPAGRGVHAGHRPHVGQRRAS